MHSSLVMLALFAGGGAPPMPASAVAVPTVVKPMFFSEILGQSELIAIGTAVASTARHEEGGNTIRTYVTFRDLVVQKGRVDGPTLVLRLEGGAVGDDRLVVAEMPQFQVGARYLLYVVGNGRNLSPIVGFNQGAFEIAQVNGREVLRNLRGEELIGIRDDRFVFAQKPAAAAGRLPASALAPQAVAVPIEAGVQPQDPDLDRREREMVARQTAAAAARFTPLQRAPEPAQPLPAPAVAPSPPPVHIDSAHVAPAAATATQPQRDARPILVPPSQDRGERIGLQTLLGAR